jgi:hypothetical protein
MTKAPIVPTATIVDTAVRKEGTQGTLAQPCKFQSLIWIEQLYAESLLWYGIE